MRAPAIVIAAYNRPHTLKRLLGSLAKASYPDNVSLIISIDEGHNEQVCETANQFTWTHGEKTVIPQKAHLGLRRHILACGDLTLQFGSIILLEDDVYVSPTFYSYALKSLAFYRDSSRIAGISLYSHLYNVHASLPFIPLKDESDVYFFQLPASSGQVWTREQWLDFKEWYSHNDGPNLYSDDLPEYVLSWPESSWVKYFTKYMVETGKFFVYPRTSYTTNFGDVGSHFPSSTLMWQVPLQVITPEAHLKHIEDSFAVYDSWFEVSATSLKSLAPKVTSFDFTVDLYGTKLSRNMKTPYVLTSKYCENAVFSFARALKPIELNVVEDIPGDDLFLCKVGDLRTKDRLHTPETLAYYYPAFPALPFRRLVSMLLLKIGSKARRIVQRF